MSNRSRPLEVKNLGLWSGLVFLAKIRYKRSGNAKP
jgi:hypothetical protein